MYTWDEIYKLYPVNETLIYLNNCGTTPANKIITNEMSRYFEEYSKSGILNKKYLITEIKDSIQTILSNLLSCEKDEVAIIHNTAEGMNLISYGLSLQKGNEILLLENEYPSNVYPWEHWKQKGVTIKFVELKNNPETFLENFKNSISENTKVASISAVHWCTGMPLPLKEIGELCKDNEILFIVDGAQGAGHVDIDVKNWNIDAMSFSAWKWLLGPLGLGVLVIKKATLDKIDFVFKGTSSINNYYNYLPYSNDIKDNAERYIYSTPNFNDWIYFNTILKFLNEIGFENVMGRIYELSDYLSSKLKNEGFILDKDYFPEYKTGIITAKKDNMDTKKAVGCLLENKIVAAERFGKIRFSPHIYNSIEQLDKVIDVLKSI